MNNKNVNYKKYLKALETLVFLANKDKRQYWILKAIYLADKEHLGRYGRQIFGDRYIAMKLGPVPSLAYDIVKSVREGATGYNFPEPVPSTALKAPDNSTVEAFRKANANLLSASEMECLADAYNLIKDLTLQEVINLTHDKAYDAAEQNDEMSTIAIIKTLVNGQEVLDYQNR
jgi:hypothetical protein